MISELVVEDLILSRYLDPADRSLLYARVGRGELMKLHSGAYVEVAHWSMLSEPARHRARAIAVNAQYSGELVFSHQTAAAMWRLPLTEAAPKVHVVAGEAGGGRSTSSLARHCIGLPEVTEVIDGLRVTTLHATVVDLASTLSFSRGVVAADAALRRTQHPLSGLPPTRVDRAQLVQEALRVPGVRGASRARRVIEFADGRADRPGESMSRASMHLARITPPQIQVRLVGASGKEYDVDFYWPVFNVIGEFDGKIKYTDPKYMNGRTPEQVLYDEKIREDDLRAARHGFSRWPWATAMSPTLLRAHLARAGVR